MLTFHVIYHWCWVLLCLSLSCRLGHMVAMFRYSSVATYTVSMPPQKLEFSGAIRQEWLSKETQNVYSLLGYSCIDISLICTGWNIIVYIVGHSYVLNSHTFHALKLPFSPCFKVYMKGITLFTEVANCLKTIQFDGLGGSIRDFSEVEKMLKQEQEEFEVSFLFGEWFRHFFFDKEST